MKLPKSKLGFLLAAVYIFVASLFFMYAKFACSTDALYCGMIAFMPAFPFILLTATFTSIFLLPASADLEMIVIFFIPVLVNVVLAYFIGSLIQKKFSSKVTRIVGIGAIIIAIMIAGILGIRYFNKSDVFKPNVPVNVSNPIKSRNYCQQDSDCVLAPQYQGCCPDTCNNKDEAVNVETKNMDEEARNKQYNCHLKDIVCPSDDCLLSGNKQAVCEQNRCVVKERIQISSIASYIPSSHFGKIPVRISTSENIYSESPTTLLNSGLDYYPIRSIAPELSRGKTVTIEGVYYVYRNDDPRVDWAWNGNKSASSRICLNKKLDIPDGAVIQAKIFISPTPQEYCETGEIKEFKILYTASSLAELSKKFSPICDDFSSFLTEEHKENPLKLYTCFGNVSPEGIFGEKFTRSYFEWLPFEDKVVVEMWAVSEKTTKENKENICKLERKGAIVLNLVSEKIEEIYITQAEEICEIID